jgi:two-component system, NarL family, nitrate/nitrite response regulator NarL
MHILLVDDHQALCFAFSEHLKRIASQFSPEPLTVMPVFTFDAAVAELSANRPDFVFLDLDLGDGRHGIATLEQFATVNTSKIPVVVFTGLSVKIPDARETLRQCLRDFGVKGILLKSTDLDEIFLGISRILQGGTWVPPDVLMELASTTPPQQKPGYHLGLSPREWQVANLIVKGYPDKRIANELNLQPGYVRQVVTQIFKKLEVPNRTSAAERLLRGQLS